MKTDILMFVGCGVSGLSCALNLPRDEQILIITKSDLTPVIPSWPREESVC